MSDLLRDLNKRVVGDQFNILTLDIERLPGWAWKWSPGTDYTSAYQFKEWPRLLCFGARWYGQKKPIFHAEWDGRRDMVQAAWELYDRAEIVVTYNGKRFDDRHLKDEWLMAGLAPPRPWKAVDLYAVVRREFGFESKSLDMVCRRLGSPGKQRHYNADQAFAAVEGDVKAQRELRRYNLGDVELTEWLYDRVRGWDSTHPHLGYTDDTQRCNQCGSDDLVEQSTKYRAVLLDYKLFRCGNCGGMVRASWHSARTASTRGVR